MEKYKNTHTCTAKNPQPLPALIVHLCVHKSPCRPSFFFCIPLCHRQAVWKYFVDNAGRIPGPRQNRSAACVPPFLPPAGNSITTDRQTAAIETPRPFCAEPSVSSRVESNRIEPTALRNGSQAEPPHPRVLCARAKAQRQQQPLPAHLQAVRRELPQGPHRQPDDAHHQEMPGHLRLRPHAGVSRAPRHHGPGSC